MALRWPTAFPVIEHGERVLREIRQTDAAAWHAYLTDPAVRALTSWDVRSKDDVQRTIETMAQRFRAQEALRFAVARRADDALIGTCGFIRLDASDARAEIGYDLAPAHWGRGVMTEIVGRVVRYGFEELGLHRIDAVVIVGNARSARVLEKNGFGREGTLRAYRHVRGAYADVWVYGRVA